MTEKLIKFLIKRCRLSPSNGRQSGFSLLELLASMIIVTVIITTILALVVDLLGTNQKETAQTDTQQEMQRAIDYIASELREAIYIYDNRCFQGDASAGCPIGIFNYLSIPNGSVPVLAFWKLEPLPESCHQFMGQEDDPCKGLRIGGRTYSLVVYYLSTNNLSNIWTGKARITRYQLDRFSRANTANPQLVPGYIDPDPQGRGFAAWPYQATGSHTVNPAVLVDFVDVNNEARDVQCPQNYELTPSPQLARDRLSQTNLGFYACIRRPEDKKAQDALIFIRGNAKGKPGVTTDAYLPVLQTQVMRRSVFGLSGN